MSRRFFLTRLMTFIPTLLLVSGILFALLNTFPGGPVDALLAKSTGVGDATGSRFTFDSPKAREALVRQYELDRPLWRRYLAWVSKTAQGDFGISFHTGRSVWEEIRPTLPVTLGLGLGSFALTYLLAFLFGTLLALSRRGRIVASHFLNIANSVPTFALALVLLLVFAGAGGLEWFPLGGSTSEDYESLSVFGRLMDRFRHLILPIVAMSLQQVAVYSYLVAQSFRSELSKEYPRVARAKGLDRKQVLLHHVLPNGILPLVVAAGDWIPICFVGNLLVEILFNIQGVGELTYRSLLWRDYPVVLCVLTLAAFAQLVFRLFTDMVLAFMDPRVRFA